MRQEHATCNTTSTRNSLNSSAREHAQHATQHQRVTLSTTARVNTRHSTQHATRKRNNNTASTQHTLQAAATSRPTPAQLQADSTSLSWKTGATCCASGATWLRKTTRCGLPTSERWLRGTQTRKGSLRDERKHPRTRQLCPRKCLTCPHRNPRSRRRSHRRAHQLGRRRVHQLGRRRVHQLGRQLGHQPGVALGSSARSAQ